MVSTKHKATVTFESQQPEVRLRVLLGDGPVTVEEGFGGWAVIERPKRVGLTVWEGHTPLKVTIPVALGALDGSDADDEVKTLRMLAGRGPGAGGQPATLSITSPGSFMPYQSLDWVIDDFTLTEPILDRNGNYERSLGTVTVLQYLTDKTLTESAAEARRNLKRQGPKSYTTKQGDTWKSVAKKVWGKDYVKYSRRISKANPKVKEAHGKLTKGKKLKIPARPN